MFHLLLFHLADCYGRSGLTRDEVADDPRLGNKRLQLVTEAARKLARARMISFDEKDGSFTITDLGRIAAKYYIRSASIEIYNEEFRPKMTEADVLAMLSRSTEVRVTPVHEITCLRPAYIITVRPNSASRKRGRGVGSSYGNHTMRG